MACGCGGAKATTTTVYVLTTKDGVRSEHATRGDAATAQTLAGGGTITPVRK